MDDDTGAEKTLIELDFGGELFLSSVADGTVRIFFADKPYAVSIKSPRMLLQSLSALLGREDLLRDLRGH